MKFCKAIITVVLFGRMALISAQIRSTANSVNLGSKPAVSLRLSAGSTQLKMGQPMRLSIFLTNISSKDILVGDELGGGESDYNVFMYDDRGNAPPRTAYYRSIKGIRRPDDPLFGGSHSRNTLIVPPSKIVENTINIERVYKIDHPGIYTVWVERRDGVSNTDIKSNTIQLTIIP